jgi:hypothetical protein
MDSVKDPFSFLDFKSVDQLDSTPPDVIWYNCISAGDRVMISGATKSYKSFFAKQMLYCMNYGLPFLERKMEREFPMVDFDMELREYYCGLRVKAIAKALNNGDVGRWRSVCLRGKAKLLDETAIAQIGVRMKSTGRKGFGLDPIYRLQRDGNGDNSAQEVNTLLDPFDQISTEYDLLFIWIHHHSKGNQAGKTAHERASGSGGWARYADVIIDLIMHQEQFCFIVEITQRNFEAIPKFVVEFDIKKLVFVRRYDLSAEDVQEKEVGRPNKIDGQIEVILALVRAFEDNGGISRKDLEGLSMIPTSSVTKVVKQCSEKIHLSPLDKNYHLTSKYKTQCAGNNGSSC